MYYFYVLYSEKDDQHYYGSTNDLKYRVEQHQAGKVDSTEYRRPLNLIYYEAYLDEEVARTREQSVKNNGGTRTALLKRLKDSD